MASASPPSTPPACFDPLFSETPSKGKLEILDSGWRDTAHELRYKIVAVGACLGLAAKSEVCRLWPSRPGHTTDDSPAERHGRVHAIPALLELASRGGHQLLHTFNWQWRNAAISGRHCSGCNGHASIETPQRYVKLGDKVVQREAERLAHGT